MWTKCIVATYDSGGKPSLYGCHVQVSRKDYDKGEHYHRAVEKARREGYSHLNCVVFDEVDGPSWLFRSMFQAVNPERGRQRGSGTSKTFVGNELLDRLEDEIVMLDAGCDDLREPGMLEAYFVDEIVPKEWKRWPWIFLAYGPLSDEPGRVTPFSVEEGGRGLHTMFYRLYRTMAVAVLAEKGKVLGIEMGRDVQVYVEGFSDYDCTCLVVCNRRGLERPVVLALDQFKPWGFRWDTPEELGEYLYEVCRRIDRGLDAVAVVVGA